MKGIISTVPVSIPSRSGSRTGIVFVAITKDERDVNAQRRVLTVKDYEVIQRENPQPGETLWEYRLIETTTRVRTFTQINGVWAYLAKDVVHTEPLEDQFNDLYADFILLETQQKPIRDSQPQDWVKHTMNTEIVPLEEPPIIEE